MSDEQKARENEVFDQELSLDDLDAAAGGGTVTIHESSGEDMNNCIQEETRSLNGGKGYPNCANTVNLSIECNESDFCHHCAIIYL